MGYSNELEAPLAMPISDYSGRSSRSSKGPRSNLKQGLKALLSPITPGRKKRSVLSTEPRSRKSLSPKLFGLSPKTPGGRKKFVMNQLSIKNLGDDDDDEDHSTQPDSKSPKRTPTRPIRKLSKNTMINTLSIANLDDDDDDDDELNDKPAAPARRSSAKLSPKTPGGRRKVTKKSLILSDIFMKGFSDDEDDEINISDEENDTGPSALEIWRAERKLAMSADHVTCRDYEGNSKASSKPKSKPSVMKSPGALRRVFSKSDPSVRYSIRKEKVDDSLNLAKLVMDEMNSSEEYSQELSGDF
ncbi:MAG: hypothetical protein SGBAC_009628 [Bacillariaceae sp.]